MAEETQKTAPSAPVAAAEEVVVVVSDVPEAEKPTTTTTDREAPPQPEPEAAPEKPVQAEEVVAVEGEKSKPTEEEEKISQSVSFKEETNVVGDLPDPEKKALDELKLLIQEALNKHEFTAPPPVKEEEKPAIVEPEAEVKETTPEPVVATEEVAKTEEKCEPDPEIAAPPAPVEPKEEEKVCPPAEAAEPVVKAEVVETGTVVDEDGAKTVEAIEETIVAVSAPAPPCDEPGPSEATVEAPGEESKVEVEEVPQVPPPPPEEVFIWGIPLLGDDRSDVILLKFLRARDFKPKEAFAMIKSTVRWRKEFGIDALLDEDLGSDLGKVVFMHGFDKEGHPVCYNVYGEFQDKELYNSAFSDEEKRQKFLKWRIQFLEKSIRKLDFSPDGVCTIVQVNDLKNSPGPHKRELRQATNQALQLLQDNYPEFVAKQVFINVPWWYLAFHRMISPFLTHRTKSKFVFAGPSRSADTLFKYITPEQVPVQYGGLSREGEQEFTTADAITEVIIKPSTKHTVEFPASESCHLVWEVRVVGWDVCYGAEFVPAADDGYTVIVHKTRKVAPTEEPVICNSFKIGESGKVVLTIDNQSSKKKKLLYRSKTKSSSSD